MNKLHGFWSTLLAVLCVQFLNSLQCMFSWTLQGRVSVIATALRLQRQTSVTMWIWVHLVCLEVDEIHEDTLHMHPADFMAANGQQRPRRCPWWKGIVQCWGVCQPKQKSWATETQKEIGARSQLGTIHDLEAGEVRAFDRPRTKPEMPSVVVSLKSQNEQGVHNESRKCDVTAFSRCYAQHCDADRSDDFVSNIFNGWPSTSHF